MCEARFLAHSIETRVSIAFKRSLKVAMCEGGGGQIHLY